MNEFWPARVESTTPAYFFSNLKPFDQQISSALCSKCTLNSITCAILEQAAMGSRPDSHRTFLTALPTSAHARPRSGLLSGPFKTK